MFKVAALTASSVVVAAYLLAETRKVLARRARRGGKRKTKGKGHHEGHGHGPVVWLLHHSFHALLTAGLAAVIHVAFEVVTSGHGE